MKVSVIIPALNEEDYISQTVQAVLAQNFSGQFEIIVVDNDSSDGTSEIIRFYDGVKLLVEETKGVQIAREKGRKEAKGEILALLDADSIPPKDWLEKGISCFNDQMVVGVSGPYDYYDTGEIRRFLFAFCQRVLYPAIHFIVQGIFRQGAVMIGGNSFLRARAMEQINGFDTSIRFYGDDVDTGRRLTKVGKVLYRRDIFVKSSARRMKGFNGIKIPLIYVINFFCVLFFKRPFSKPRVS